MPQIVLEDHIDKRNLRFMGAGAAYNFIAMEQAIADAGLTPEDISNDARDWSSVLAGRRRPTVRRPSHRHRKGAPKRMGPFMVTRCMSRPTRPVLARLQDQGVNYSITSACSTSAHCVGNGVELIQMGKQDIVFAGGGEELDWTLSCLFDAMGAMSSKYNDTPQTASRPFDATRDGFVIAGGAGVVVLRIEPRPGARRKIYAEVTGYGATSDGYDMVAPSGEGGERSMRLALSTPPEGAASAMSTRTAPRPRRRCRRDQGPAPGLWRGRGAAGVLDQVADRPFAGRDRRP